MEKEEKVDGGIDEILAMTYGELVEKVKKTPYIKIVFKEKETRRRTSQDETYLAESDLVQVFSLRKDTKGNKLNYSRYVGSMIGIVPDDKSLSVDLSNIKEVFFLSL